MERLVQLARKYTAKHRHFVLYILIGLSGVTIDYSIFALGTKALGVGVLVANFIAISAGIINNFWLNNRYNFKTHDHALKRFAFFYGVGAMGILLSEFLILVFHYGMGINDLLAKLLTLPFVLIFQFLLNKRFSFGDIKQTERQLKRAVFHWPIIVVLILYACFSLVLVAVIPANFKVNNVKGGPDEAVHYRFNVEFIKDHKRLPVSGKDDIEALKACRTNPIGLVPCVYSYNTYPGPNYIISAISAGLLGHKGSSLSPQIAARFTSFMSGILFVVFSYAAAYCLLRRRLFATVLVAMMAFIPQVIFTNSYTNMDAHSLAVSAFLGFTLVLFMQQPRSRKRQIALSIALFGLLPVSKYNYFALGAGSLALIVYTGFKQRFTRNEILRFGLYAIVSFLALSSFWYIRNLVLYHDLLGQKVILEEMSKYHTLGTPRPLNIASINMLIHLDFFNILFRSFFFGFGLMNFFLEEYNYKIILCLLFVCGSLFMYNLAQPTIKKSEQIKLVALTVLYVLVVLGTLLGIVYNSLHYDFQPQGRYMYPILVPTILFLAYAIKQDARHRILPFLMLGGTAFLFFQGLDLFVRVYFTI